MIYTLLFAFFYIGIVTQPLHGMRKRTERTASQKKDRLKKSSKKRNKSEARNVFIMPHAPDVPSLHDEQALQVSMLSSMIKAGADLHEIQDGHTPLHRFVQAGNTDCIAALLAHGALQSYCNMQGEIPLHDAAKRPMHVAHALLTSPQGSPTHITQKMRDWQETLILFSYALKKRKFSA